MSDLLTTLASRPGEYEGRGVNHQQEPFTGHLRIEPLVGGKAVMLHYTAVRDDGVQVHAEATLLARAATGGLCLWPVMEELPIVLPHRPIEPTAPGPDAGLAVTFASGPRDAVQAFREELTITVDAGGVLVYAHAWGLPGGEFRDRSRCALRRRPA